MRATLRRRPAAAIEVPADPKQVSRCRSCMEGLRGSFASPDESRSNEDSVSLSRWNDPGRIHDHFLHFSL